MYVLNRILSPVEEIVIRRITIDAALANPTAADALAAPGAMLEPVVSTD
jgi:hypothetical protein